MIKVKQLVTVLLGFLIPIHMPSIGPEKAPQVDEPELLLMQEHTSHDGTRLVPGKNTELFEALNAIYLHIGVVSVRLWVDKASTMVRQILRGGERT